MSAPKPLGYLGPHLQPVPLKGKGADGSEIPIRLPDGVVGVLFVYETREAALAVAGPAGRLMAVWRDDWLPAGKCEELAAPVVMAPAEPAAVAVGDTRKPGVCELCGRPAVDVREVQFRRACRSGYHDETKAACRSCRTRRHGMWRYVRDA